MHQYHYHEGLQHDLICAELRVLARVCDVIRVYAPPQSVNPYMRLDQLIEHKASRMVSRD
jgi:hypothetical protein